ncbi:hypothetical protein Y032_0930g3086 [Ancylostoma ceylanicum]|uniref:Protein kinase domain-containing protein n=1 Tax=Ancylostoma ceylanicum TaxID=53326 RepID=A0A016W956_9BILA|nr:hypothetical protein Y032_0930g3086 [Ancylostoma ceylanicum]
MRLVCGYKRRLKKGSIVAREWRIIQKLGEGGFGAVYKVVNIETRTFAAFKVEAPREHSVLKLEAMVLRRLETCPFVPHILDSGKKPSYSYLIMSLLGPSLNKILKSQTIPLFCPNRDNKQPKNSSRFYGKVCSISTQVRIGINILYALKQLHDCLKERMSTLLERKKTE